MDAFFTAAWINFIILASAHPEIQSKGKQQRILDAQTSDEEFGMPIFAEPIPNITVTIGRDALLACVVENLKGYKVAWVRVDTQTILSIHHNVITQNERVSLTYNDHRSWYLHITNITESDRGWYMCQVNTDPMRSRKGYLQVVVPPLIIESLTSSDMVVREGANVTLICKAKGFPEPYVMWRREDGEEMAIGGEYVNVVDGEMLHITKVSRLHMAAYLCVGSNGVPPSVSKRVNLRVQFPPMLSIPNQLEGAYVGQDVTLECHTEAYPASINYWTTERGDMIISDTSRAGDKYETTSSVSGYSKFMKLKIRSVSPNDFGTYRCVAKNSLGETDGNIKLDEMPPPTNTILSETGLLNRSLDGKRLNRNKFDLNALPEYGLEEWRDVNGGGGDPGVGDNNQPPVRNPPGAFHNSAVGSRNPPADFLIRGIKMQSAWIFKYLSSYVAAVEAGLKVLRLPGDAREGLRTATIKATAKHVKRIHDVIVIQSEPAKMTTGERISIAPAKTTQRIKTIDTDDGNADTAECCRSVSYVLRATAVRHSCNSSKRRQQNSNHDSNIACHIGNNRNNSDQPFNVIPADAPIRTCTHFSPQTIRTYSAMIISNPRQMLQKIFAYIRSNHYHKSQHIHHKQIVFIYISIAILSVGLVLLLFPTPKCFLLFTEANSKMSSDRKRSFTPTATASKYESGTYLNGPPGRTTTIASDSKYSLSESR